MKIAGVISEYNPFHNGHKYHLQQTREQTGADYIIVIMSGNFVQRGVPAMYHKYLRAKQALLEGADLVLELPALYSTASAPNFAYGAVSSLLATNLISHLSFGMEAARLDDLKAIADFLTCESVTYQHALRAELSKGCSFPIARIHAIEGLISKQKLSTDLKQLLETPNNILAIEYLKVLNQKNAAVTPMGIHRRDSGYHSTNMELDFSSATAIRNEIFTNGLNDKVKAAIPPASFEMFRKESSARPITPDSITDLLQYVLTRHRGSFTGYSDLDEELSNRLSKIHYGNFSFEELSNQLTGKHTTKTHCYRALLHIFLDITKEYDSYFSLDTVPYLRVLGVKRETTSLLKYLHNTCHVPIIEKVTTAKKQFYQTGNTLAEHLFALDLKASECYNLIYKQQYHDDILSDYKQNIILV